MLEGETASLKLRFFAEIAMHRTIEKARPLRHSRNLIVDNQGRWPLDAVHRFHRELAHVSRSAVLPPALEAGRCTANAKPVSEAFRFQGRTAIKRLIGRQFVIGGHRAD